MRKVPPHLYPFEGKRFEVGGHAMHYLDEGQGPPVLMVHGNGTWSIAFRRLVAALGPTHRCVVPDHVGMGLSDKPGDDSYAYTLRQRVDDLARLVERLDLKGVTLVGHDWGGIIAMAWAVEHPERVARFVMMNTVAFQNPEGRPLPATVRLMRGPLGTLLVRGFNAIGRGLTTYGVARPLPAEVRDAFLAPYDSWAHRIALHRFVQDLPLCPEDPAFELIARTEEGLGLFAGHPALVCWGMRDFLLKPVFLAEWEKRWPHALVQRFETAGHFLLEDEPELVVGAVQAFLAKTASP